MLLGRSEGKVDEKGRITLPKLYAEILTADSGTTLFLTLGDQDELAIWPESAFLAKLAEYKSREATSDGAKEFRRFTSHAAQFELDKNNRILLTERMRASAGIALKGDVVCIGASDRVEIWDPARFDAYLEGRG